MWVQALHQQNHIHDVMYARLRRQKRELAAQLGDEGGAGSCAAPASLAPITVLSLPMAPPSLRPPPHGNHTSLSAFERPAMDPSPRASHRPALESPMASYCIPHASEFSPGACIQGATSPSMPFATSPELAMQPPEEYFGEAHLVGGNGVPLLPFHSLVSA